MGQIISGQFSGEMSLLTREPKSTTVVAATCAIVYEIRTDNFTEFVTNRPSLRVVPQRRLKNDEAVSNKDKTESETPTAHIVDQILDKMLGVFDIRKA